MIVSEFIDWLKTQDQKAVVEVLSHSSGSGYYDQGGWCTVEDFTIEEDFAQIVEEDSTARPAYIYGEHFEYVRYNGTSRLRLGIMDK